MIGCAWEIKKTSKLSEIRDLCTAIGLLLMLVNVLILILRVRVVIVIVIALTHPLIPF